MKLSPLIRGVSVAAKSFTTFASSSILGFVPKSSGKEASVETKTSLDKLDASLTSILILDRFVVISVETSEVFSPEVAVVEVVSIADLADDATGAEGFLLIDGQ